MEYMVGRKILTWEHTATDPAENNLYIKGIWNMKDTVGYTDTCVAVSVISDDIFYFVTFNGLGFTMQVVDNEVRCIKKQITK